jgi:hypothetical protein
VSARAVLTLVVLAVGAGADRFPPPGVVAIPLDGAHEALAEADVRLLTQGLKLCAGQRVASIVPGAIGHELDQRFIPARQLEDPLGDGEVVRLVRAPAVVNLPRLAILEGMSDSPREVLDEQPNYARFARRRRPAVSRRPAR